MLTGKSPTVTAKPRATNDGSVELKPLSQDSNRVIFQTFHLNGLPERLLTASSPHIPGHSVSPAANRRPGHRVVLREDDFEVERADGVGTMG